MKRKTLSPLVFVVALYVLAISKGFPLEKTTHEYLNQQIARRTVNEFSLDSYLKNSLGFREGAQELLSGYSEVKKKEMEQRVWQWIGEGGIKEDEPEQMWRQIVAIARNKNHFHNPLGGLWMYSGLDDTYVFYYTGESSILWAQNPNQDPGGKWSWYDARDYFYKALTLTDKTRRDSAMANCFRGLRHKSGFKGLTFIRGCYIVDINLQ